MVTMKKRFLSVVLCLCMVVGMVPAIITTVQASTNGHTRDEAVSWARSKIGTADDFDGNYGAQCVDLIYAYYTYLGQRHPGGHAYYYMSNALPSGWTRYTNGQTTPQPGDVVVYNAYEYNAAWTGHVGIVVESNSQNYTYVDYNGCGNNGAGYTCPGGLAHSGWRSCPGGSGSLRTKALNQFSCVIRPDWTSPPSNVTVNWSDYNRHSISTTSPTATLARRATISGASVSRAQCGIYLYNSSGALVASKREDVAPANGIVNMWYDVAGELGYSLTAGASYTYKFVLSFNGKDYYSPVYSFVAGGIPTYTITATASAGGTVTGGGQYDNLETAWLKASPNEGYRFVGWMENGSILSNSTEFGIVVRTNRILTAVFEKDQVSTLSYTITVIAADGGTVTGGGTYKAGELVTLEAIPNEGYKVKHWLKDGKVHAIADGIGVTATSDLTLTVVFEKITYYTITTIATDGGVCSPGVTCAKGARIAISAIPNKGYIFKGWMENGKIVCATTHYNFTAESDRTLTAVFEAKEAPAEIYSIDVSASPSAGGTVTGGGSYANGKSATVKAAANSGYIFKGWTENGSTVSTNASYTFTVSANRTLTAVFEKGGATVPTVTTWPTAAAVNYGQTLASSALSGGKASVSGTFQWNNSSIVPKPGQSYDITFIPSDTTKYNTVSGKVSVTVNKSTPTLSLSASQSGTAVTVAVSASNPYNTALADVPAPAVTYRIGNGTAQNVAGGSFAIPEGTASGTVITITASTAENGNYRAAEKSTTLAVTGTTNKTSHYILTTSGSDLGGSVSVQPTSARQGETVTVSAVPRNGYRLQTVTATDANGAVVSLTNLGGGRYTFIMPDSNVTLDVVFETTQDGWVNPFSDIAEGAWYYDAVKFVSQNGLMNGSNGVFDHSGNLSRAMIAQILYNKEGRPITAAGQMFSDVAVDKWYADAVSWASGKKLIFGNEKGLFLPDNPVTREELAVILWRYEGSPTTSGRTLNFTDAGRISGYAREAVGWAVANGIISGKGGGVLDPKGPATRAQVAQMLKNYFGS